MWARVELYQGEPQQVQTTITRLQNEEIPALQRLTSLSSGFWALNSESTAGLNLTLWQNERALAWSADVIRHTRRYATGVQFVSMRQYEVPVWSMVDETDAMQTQAARLGTFRGAFQGQLMDEHLRYLREEFLAFTRQLPGALGSFYLIDRPAGDMLSFSLWARREDIQHGSELVKQRAQQRLAAGGKPGPVPNGVEIFDVWKSVWP